MPRTVRESGQSRSFTQYLTATYLTATKGLRGGRTAALHARVRWFEPAAPIVLTGASQLKRNGQGLKTISTKIATTRAAAR